MVLDGEQHETLGVLLQEGLIGLKWLDGSSDGSLGLLDGALLDLLLLQLDGLDILDGDVLLVGTEVELLDGGIDSECLDGRSSLQFRVSKSQLRKEKAKVGSVTRLTALEGVTLAAIATGLFECVLGEVL